MTDRLVVIAPALAVAVYFFTAWCLFVGLSLAGRRPADYAENRKHSAFFYFFIHYFLWLLRPYERMLRASPLTPNHMTLLGLAACAGCGIAVGSGHMATAGWILILAGAFDILDGRLARYKNLSTRAGGFLDAVSDRWGELFVFAGYAWFLRESYWLLFVMLAVTGSMMVSYTRAKGEAWGVKLDGGHMQRAERLAILSIGLLVTAWFNATRETAEIGTIVLGVSVALTGLGSSITAVNRLLQGFRALAAQDRAEEPAAEDSVQLHEQEA